MHFANVQNKYMVKEKYIDIEIVYAMPDEQTLLKIQVPEGVDVNYAINKSGILTKHPQIDTNKNKVGIFGRLCSLTTKLSAGDRVEIYRTLHVDPKEQRRKKVR